MSEKEELMQIHIHMLEGVLSDIRDLIDGYVDVTDGDYGVPKANKAMRAVQLIDEALGGKP
jgi:hypothetical protein